MKILISMTLLFIFNYSFLYASIQPQINKKLAPISITNKTNEIWNDIQNALNDYNLKKRKLNTLFQSEYLLKLEVINNLIFKVQVLLQAQGITEIGLHQTSKELLQKIKKDRLLKVIPNEQNSNEGTFYYSKFNFSNKEFIQGFSERAQWLFGNSPMLSTYGTTKDLGWVFFDMKNSEYTSYFQEKDKTYKELEIKYGYYNVMEGITIDSSANIPATHFIDLSCEDEKIQALIESLNDMNGFRQKLALTIFWLHKLIEYFSDIDPRMPSKRDYKKNLSSS